MKKLISALLLCALTLSLSVTAFAAKGSFIQSPSVNPEVEIVEGTTSDPDCEAVLKVTAYSNKHTLPDATKAALEAAYNTVATTTDLSVLNDDLAALAAKLNILGSDLAVSDLFDISTFGCVDHLDHDGKFSIKLKAQTLENFVGLLHCEDGVWELVADAKVSEDGEHLSFSVDSFSPFAIVVNSAPDDDPSTPTGDAFTWIVLAVGVASAFGLALIFVNKKRQKA